MASSPSLKLIRPGLEERAARVGLLGEDAFENLPRVGELALLFQLHAVRETLLIFGNLGRIERLLGFAAASARLRRLRDFDDVRLRRGGRVGLLGEGRSGRKHGQQERGKENAGLSFSLARTSSLVRRLGASEIALADPRHQAAQARAGLFDGMLRARP